jgi:hypothetical protein
MGQNIFDYHGPEFLNSSSRDALFNFPKALFVYETDCWVYSLNVNFKKGKSSVMLHLASAHIWEDKCLINVSYPRIAVVSSTD